MLKGLAIALLGATVLLPAAAQAQWRADQVQIFTSECVGACIRGNPGQDAFCARYCQCCVDAGQRRFSAADFDQMNEDAKAGRQSDMLRAMMAIGQQCNQSSQ